MPFAVTLYNIEPEVACEGSNVPFHSIIDHPFKRPFTFGPKMCGGKESAHVGVKSHEAICGAFVGSCGEFLVMSEHKFVIMTPKYEGPIALRDVLFPRRDTHHVLDARMGKSYHITVGSSILVYDSGSKPFLKSVTLFLGNGPSQQQGDAYHNGLPYFCDCLSYCAALMAKFFKYKQEQVIVVDDQEALQKPLSMSTEVQ